MEAEQYYCKENSIKMENLSAEDDEIIWMLKEYHTHHTQQEAQERYNKGKTHLLIHYFGARGTLLIPEKEALRIASGLDGERKEEKDV